MSAKLVSMETGHLSRLDHPHIRPFADNIELRNGSACMKKNAVRACSVLLTAVCGDRGRCEIEFSLALMRFEVRAQTFDFTGATLQLWKMNTTLSNWRMVHSANFMSAYSQPSPAQSPLKGKASKRGGMRITNSVSACGRALLFRVG